MQKNCLKHLKQQTHTLHNSHYNHSSLDRLSKFENKFWLFPVFLKNVNHTTKYVMKM